MQVQYQCSILHSLSCLLLSPPEILTLCNSYRFPDTLLDRRIQMHWGLLVGYLNIIAEYASLGTRKGFPKQNGGYSRTRWLKFLKQENPSQLHSPQELGMPPHHCSQGAINGTTSGGMNGVAASPKSIVRDSLLISRNVSSPLVCRYTYP